MAEIAVLVEAAMGGPEDDEYYLRVGWLGDDAALVRDAAPKLADFHGRLVDVRALLLTAAGFVPVDVNNVVRPPELKSSWRVQVRGERVTAVSTVFDPSPELLSCGWLPSGDNRAVPQEWLDAACRTGRVALLCADLNPAVHRPVAGPPQPAATGLPLQGRREAWPALAGLAVLDLVD